MTPDLTDYHIILINTSGGKDSQAMLDLVIELADTASVRDRIVAVHADLGRMEWEGTKELAAHQCSLYGVPMVVTARTGGDLLDAIRKKGKFPDRPNRWCTSDFKRGPVLRVMTALVREQRAIDPRQVRILNCMGLRAQESVSRAKELPFEFNERASNGRRHVDNWLPIHSWTVEQVWARIHASGVPYHPVYDSGMGRLSCSFCVLAPKTALVRAAQLRPDLATEYATVEAEIGFRFTDKLSMADIIAAAAAAPDTNTATVIDWAA